MCANSRAWSGFSVTLDIIRGGGMAFKKKTSERAQNIPVNESSIKNIISVTNIILFNNYITRVVKHYRLLIFFEWFYYMVIE